MPEEERSERGEEEERGFGRRERESAVRALTVVVLDVDAQDSFELAAAADQ
jgi:hypothetical protein